MYIFILCTFFSVLSSPNKVYAQNYAIVNATDVNIRSGPGTSYSIIGKLTAGNRISITGSQNDTSGHKWYSFLLSNKNAYIREDFVRVMQAYVLDQTFENELSNEGFPEDYKIFLRELHQSFPNWVFKAQKINMDFSQVVNEELSGTRTLVRSNAISSHKSTDLGKYDWNTSTWPSFDGASWVAASKEITEYYLDPRNFLNEVHIFQFEKQTYNSLIQTRAGLLQMVKGTFLDSYINAEGLSYNIADNNSNNIINNITNISPTPIIDQNQVGSIIIGGAPTGLSPYGERDNEITGYSSVVIGPGANITNSPNQIISPGVISQNVLSSDGNTFTYLPQGQYHYVDVILNACIQANINPYAFVSMIFQEQGKEGKSESITGTNKKFPGNYNYINIGAFAGSGYSAIENGLLYAATEGTFGRPWNTKEKAIYGAADYYSTGYVSKGQDTFYLKKWNVQGDNMFKHQYMTNVSGGASEGAILSQAYDDTVKSFSHEFKIPIYNNMPSTIVEYPTKDGSPNNKLKSLGVSGYILTPTFNMDTQEYSLIVPTNVSSVVVNATLLDKKAAIAGIGTISLQATLNKVHILVVAENKDQRYYTINITRQGYIGNMSEVDVGINTTNNNSNIISVPQVPIITNDIIVPTDIGSSTIIEGPPTNQNIINNIINNSSVSTNKGPGE
ncbi:MAG: SH3 domain-containing protein [Eubacteriales bacterium]|nr:SH3 domain-containing protein [Eubacteriales bacterium]